MHVVVESRRAPRRALWKSAVVPILDGRIPVALCAIVDWSELQTSPAAARRTNPRCPRRRTSPKSRGGDLASGVAGQQSSRGLPQQKSVEPARWIGKMHRHQAAFPSHRNAAAPAKTATLAPARIVGSKAAERGDCCLSRRGSEGTPRAGKQNNLANPFLRNASIKLLAGASGSTSSRNTVEFNLQRRTGELGQRWPRSVGPREPMHLSRRPRATSPVISDTASVLLGGAPCGAIAHTKCESQSPIRPSIQAASGR
jgi:hypothetical protein